jgi:Mn2+/Fe2+ NRAMP family transporter
LKATVLPHFELNFSFLFIITGVLGTTISPYMFFGEASQEVEEQKEWERLSHHKPKVSRGQIKRMRIDNTFGMLFSEFTTWSIIVVAATVLHNSGITDIKSASDAAKAIEPLVHTFPNAGFLAKLIFSIGIIGLGLLAVPVLSGSVGYAACEAFNWKSGLNLKLKRAPAFYAVICISTLIGLLINYSGVDPVKALVYAAVLNGIAAVPLLFLIIRITSNRNIMGEFKTKIFSKILLWFTFVTMAAAAIVLFYTVYA